MKRTYLLRKGRKCGRSFRIVRNSVVVAALTLVIAVASAQDLPSGVPLRLTGTSAMQMAGFPGLSSPSTVAGLAGGAAEAGNASSAGLGVSESSADGQSVPLERHRRLTLEQVKQQSASRMASPLAYMGHLSVEAARQHRLGVQADYFPKFSASFLNLHATDYLGQIVQIRHPLTGNAVQVPVQIVNQNMTMGALTVVQPITPIFAVRQAVRIARADERIAMAKAAASISKNARDTQVEDTYFKLLIAQRQLISAEWKRRGTDRRPLYASTSIDLVQAPGEDAGTIEAAKAVETAAATVKELTASLNRIMGWPEDTELELAVPDPLVENISLQEVADKSTAVNPSLVEAEQTVVKARAAASISKMAYFPVVAAVGGYLFQNILPAVNSNFGYGGVVASYTLFDFGKREHAVKEARAQLGMAETALQLAKAKLAGDLKKSYFDLERSRQLSQVAQKMGSSAVLLMKVSAGAESPVARAARADIELEMLEADFAHRQAFNKLRALLGPER